MRRRVNRDRLTAILMLSPSIVLVGIFVYGFIGSTAWTSLTDSNALQQLSKLPANFVGLRNFTELFTGVLYQRFRIDIVNTVFFTIMFIVVCLVVGILLAILLDQKIKGEGIFRTIFLFPMALSFVVTGVIWKWLFNPNSGLNVLPTFIGLPAGKFSWFVNEDKLLRFNWQNVPAYLGMVVMGIIIFFALRAWAKHRSGVAALMAALALLVLAWISFGNPQQVSGLVAPEYHGFNVALLAVVLAAGWQMSGYTMAMYLAGLRGIPDELREAARVDGASELSVYRRVVFPLLAPITLSAMIILGHISLKIFDLVFALAGGDNLYVDMPGINMWFTTFRGGDFARGAVIAIIMLIMVAVVIIPYLVINLRGEKSL